jgi:hypothetical protein
LLDRDETRADHHGLEAAPHRFDFRQFGHSGVLDGMAALA